MGCAIWTHPTQLCAALETLGLQRTDRKVHDVSVDLWRSGLTIDIMEFLRATRESRTCNDYRKKKSFGQFGSPKALHETGLKIKLSFIRLSDIASNQLMERQYSLKLKVSDWRCQKQCVWGQSLLIIAMELGFITMASSIILFGGSGEEGGKCMQ